MTHSRNRNPKHSLKQRRFLNYRHSLNRLALAGAAIWLTALLLAGTPGPALGSPQERGNAAYKEASGQFQALRSSPTARPWDWRSLARRFAAVHKTLPGTRLGKDALYSAALSHREAWRLKGDWKDLSNAAAAFRDFASRYPADRLTDDGLMHLAALQAQGYHDPQTAIATYTRIARDFPKSDQAANSDSKANELIAALKIGAPVPGRRRFAPPAAVAGSRLRKNGALLAEQSTSGSPGKGSGRTPSSRREIKLEEYDPDKTRHKAPNPVIASQTTGMNLGGAAAGSIAAGVVFGTNRPKDNGARSQGAKSSRRNRSSQRNGMAQLKKLEYQSHPAGSRVILTTDAGVKFNFNRLQAEGGLPGRLYFDLENTGLARDLPAVTPVRDPLLHRIRISRYNPKTARVVLDLKQTAGYLIRKIPLPGELRIVVELRPITGRIARNEPSPETRRTSRTASQSPHAATGKIKPGPGKTRRPETVKIAAVKIDTVKFNTMKFNTMKSTVPEGRQAPASARQGRAMTPPQPSRKPRKSMFAAATAKAALGITAPDKPIAMVRQKGGKSGRIGNPLSGKNQDRTAFTLTPALEIRSIMLDPGHGGHDPGASGFGLKEKNLALDIAKRLRDYFKRNHPKLRVGLTRENDKFIKLSDRPLLAKKFGADLFISIHLNANDIERFHGVETYFLNLTKDASALQLAARENDTTTQSVNDLNIILADLLRDTTIVESSELARTLQSSLVGNLRNHTRKVKDLGVKQAPFLVLMGAEMPSVLVEAGFLTNRGENRRLRSAPYIDKIAKGFYEGLSRFIRQQEILASRQPSGPLALNR